MAYEENSKGATYIAKPQGGSMGDGICVFKDIKKVPSNTSKEMLVQRYISKPLLLDGYKFDLRVYVTVTGTEDGKLHAYLADEGLARFATEPYQKPTNDNMKKAYMHLTNYSINKSGENWVDES